MIGEPGAARPGATTKQADLVASHFDGGRQHVDPHWFAGEQHIPARTAVTPRSACVPYMKHKDNPQMQRKVVHVT